MKLLTLLAAVCLWAAPFDHPSFYGIPFNSISGNAINTQSLRGKTVLVTVLGKGVTSSPFIRFLDSLQRTTANVKILLVPTTDFGDSIRTAALSKLQQDLQLTITSEMHVKRANGTEQHPLFAWLTNVISNRHFDMDAKEEGVCFIIGANGILYSVLPSNTPQAIISAAVKQQFQE